MKSSKKNQSSQAKRVVAITTIVKFFKGGEFVKAKRMLVYKPEAFAPKRGEK